jgi:hypothetical protein
MILARVDREKSLKNATEPKGMNNRLTDFKFDSEEEVVTRIIKSVHAAVDRDFPNAPPAPPKYSMTVFQHVEDTRNEVPAASPREKTQKDAVPFPKDRNQRRWHLAILFVVLVALVGLWLMQVLVPH